ncbi:MAG: competence/damage-inducible protein A [Bacteroidota bacterium]|jgi:nicotinamide-nucleotide amidase
MKAEIITIGDELLIGQVIDTNSAWLGQQLSLLGISLYQRTACGDSKEQILSCLKDAENRSDIIIITGGLGPTKDDITKKTMCEYFNTTLVVDEKVLEWVTRIFRMRKMEMLETNLQQAMIPANSKTLWNRSGTAPGMWFDINNKIFISLPGVPFEMKTIFEEEAIPLIKNKFTLPFIYHRTLQTCSIGESYLAEKIIDIEETLPQHIKLAYLPSVGAVRLRLSAHGNNESEVMNDVAVIVNKMYERIGEYIYGENNDSLSEVVGKLLTNKNKTMATAESCTGGFIAHQITSIPGSSKYFTGSIVSYDNKIKQQELNVSNTILNNEGAVSEACVKQMATEILSKFNVDYAIATSGIAGPDGGSEEKPVGTVWIAVASRNEIITKKFNMGDNRERTILRTSISALDMLRKMIL